MVVLKEVRQNTINFGYNISPTQWEFMLCSQPNEINNPVLRLNVLTPFQAAPEHWGSGVFFTMKTFNVLLFKNNKVEYYDVLPYFRDRWKDKNDWDSETKAEIKEKNRPDNKRTHKQFS